MPNCTARQLQFAPCKRRQIVAEFSGGDVSSDGGVLLLRQLERRLRLLERAASTLTDPRDPERITHSVTDMLKQRVFGLCLGYEDLNDHTQLRQDVLLQAAVERATSATRLVLVTPVYRATYSGVLKAFFDLLPQSALRGSVSLLAATGASPAHYLSLDTGLRTLVASLEGWSAPTVIYALGGAGDADLLPEESATAAETLLLAGFGPSLRYSALWDAGKARAVPSDVFKRKGCSA